MSKAKKCWNGCGKPARSGSLWCSKKCRDDYDQWLTRERETMSSENQLHVGDHVTFVHGWLGEVLHLSGSRASVEFGGHCLLVPRAMLRPVSESTGSGEREPDAMAHATYWRRHLDEWGGELTVRPYDHEEVQAARDQGRDGPPWPVWIGSPPSASEDPESGEAEPILGVNACYTCGGPAEVYVPLQEDGRRRVMVCKGCTENVSSPEQAAADSESGEAEPKKWTEEQVYTIHEEAERLREEFGEGPPHLKGCQCHECEPEPMRPVGEPTAVTRLRSKVAILTHCDINGEEWSIARNAGTYLYPSDITEALDALASPPPGDARERIEQIIVHALAHQDAYARLQNPTEPDSEHVTDEVLEIIAELQPPALSTPQEDSRE